MGKRKRKEGWKGKREGWVRREKRRKNGEEEEVEE